MTPEQRKLALTAHIAASVGWLGAVAGFLPLAVMALGSSDERAVRSAFLGMALMGRLVIVPLSLASLLTGLVVSLGGPWGLFRHYWVMAKLAINILSIAILLKYMQSLNRLAALAESGVAPRDPSSVLHASLALAALLTATALSVYKPWGLTPYGSKQQERGAQGSSPEPVVGPRRGLIALAALAAAVILLGLLLHLTGHVPVMH